MFSLFSALVMTLVPLYKFLFFFGAYFIEFGVYQLWFSQVYFRIFFARFIRLLDIASSFLIKHIFPNL